MVSNSDYSFNMDIEVVVTQPSFFISNFLSLELASNQVALLDDQTPNNNPSNSVWMVSTSDPVIGATGSFLLKFNCSAGCTPINSSNVSYSAISFCSDFQMNSDMEIDNGEVSPRYQCHFISYLKN